MWFTRLIKTFVKNFKSSKQYTMKASTLLSVIFSSAVLFTTFCGCGKSGTVSPVDTKPKETNRNPNTAHVINDYDFNDSTLTKSGWTKTMEDNFDGDLSNWNILTGGFQDESQYYQASNLKIVNGILEISAKNEQVTGYNYTSGKIKSKTSISASAATPKVRIIARIKAANGYGMASVFWSFGYNFPTNGEIDFCEVKGNSTNLYTTDYFYGTTTDVNLVTNSIYFNPTDGDLSASFHVYEMEWSQNTLKSYLDGNLVETKNTGLHVPDLFGKEEYVSLNLAVGGKYYTDFNLANVKAGTMYVDYVKVFTSK